MLHPNPEIHLELLRAHQAELARKLRHAQFGEAGDAPVKPKERRRAPLGLLRARVRPTGDAS